MFPRRASTWFAWAILAALFGASVIGCGSPYYVEGQDQLGDVPDSLRILIQEKEKAKEGPEPVRADEGVYVRELATGDEGSAEKANPLPLEYSSEGPYLLRRADKVLINVLFYPELETTSIVRPRASATCLRSAAAPKRSPPTSKRSTAARCATPPRP